MYFHYFAIIAPWKRAGPFIWTNLNPLHPSMLCAKFGWNWPSGSGEEDENVKSLQTDGRTDRETTDDRWSEKLTWAFSSGELKTDAPYHMCGMLKNPHCRFRLKLAAFLIVTFPYKCKMYREVHINSKQIIKKNPKIQMLFYRNITL